MKTRKFTEPKYVGDPLNAVRIFNEKEVDEIMVADMGAKVNGKEPDFGLIGKLAAECRMPLCYAGGITTAEQVEKIVGLGVEKVGISSGAIENPGLIEESARRVGNQSVVVVMDVGRAASGYELFICNGNPPKAKSFCRSTFPGPNGFIKSRFFPAPRSGTSRSIAPPLSSKQNSATIARTVPSTAWPFPTRC